MNPDSVADLIDVLDLRPAGQDRFLGRSQPVPWGRVFGGQVLAQALVAATRTVDPDRPAHSMHGYFLRAGDPGHPIEFAVERLRDGRSFSARRTHALQAGRPILSMIASFQSAAGGLEHQQPMPDVPGPEGLPSLARLVDGLDPGLAEHVRSRPIESRYVDAPGPRADRVAHQAAWIRATAPLPDDPALHRAVLVYASDYSALEPVLRRHGRYDRTGVRMASLDHAMWWHRYARADEWLLYVVDSPSASGARGLGLGRIYTRDGVLACSVAQEGMIRVSDLG